MTERIRVVVAEPGGADRGRGVESLARALRDAGLEVIYTGWGQTPEQIVATALQEDADLIGLAVPEGTASTLFATVLELLTERDAQDVVVFGGVVPGSDVAGLQELGVAKVFTSDATVAEIVTWVRAAAPSVEPGKT